MNEKFPTEYVYVRSYSAGARLEVWSLGDFMGLMKSASAKHIYRYEDGSADKFMFWSDGVLYQLDGKGYLTLEDYARGQNAGFKDSGSEYRVTKNEKGVKEIEGVYDREGRDGDVYHFAKDLGFETFQEFQVARKAGFRNREEYWHLTSMGFNTPSDFNKAKEQGFSEAAQYYEADKLGMKNKSDYDGYQMLKQIASKYSFGTLQEAHLFAILNRSTLPRRKPIPELMKILREEGSRADWYTKRFDDLGPDGKSDFMKFLATNQTLRNIGVVHRESAEFESLSDVKILIDGSNVAKYAMKENGDKPRTKNLLVIIKELRKLRFTEIHVIGDANLEFELKGQPELAEVHNIASVAYVPSRTQADEHIIEFAKRFSARIITNDKMKDWKEQDPWVRENIDAYLVDFTIVGDEANFGRDARAKLSLDSFKTLDLGKIKGFGGLRYRVAAY